MKRKYDDIDKENNIPEEREDNSGIFNENQTSKKPIGKGDREEIKTYIRIRQIENDPGKYLHIAF